MTFSMHTPGTEAFLKILVIYGWIFALALCGWLWLRFKDKRSRAEIEEERELDAIVQSVLYDVNKKIFDNHNNN